MQTVSLQALTRKGARSVVSKVSPSVLAVLSIGCATIPLLLFERSAAANFVPVVYLIPVIFAATRWGLWPAILASLAATVAADFFFFQPLYSFWVDNRQDAIDLAIFLIVALVGGNLASRLRRETDALRRRETDIQRLYAFSRRLAACFTLKDLAAAIQDFLGQTLGAHISLFVTMPDDHADLSSLTSAPASVRNQVANMLASIGASTHTIIDDKTGDLWVLRAVVSDTAVHGVVAINVGRPNGPSNDPSQSKRVEQMLDEISVTLKRFDLGGAIGDAMMKQQGELLRDAFHGTLSHELSSPLTSVQGAAAVLRTMPAVLDRPEVAGLIESIAEESARLDDFIRNFLHATQAGAGGLRPRLDWCDPGDIVAAARRRRAKRLSAHRIELSAPHDLPLIWVDCGLVEEACGQLLENAAKYSHPGSRIAIDMHMNGDRFVIDISDQGVGICQDEQRRIGRRAYRSPRHLTSIPGSGLGFWIASTFIKANGGLLRLSSPGPDLGTTVSIIFPAERTCPSELVNLENE